MSICSGQEHQVAWIPRAICSIMKPAHHGTEKRTLFFSLKAPPRLSRHAKRQDGILIFYQCSIICSLRFLRSVFCYGQHFCFAGPFAPDVCPFALQELGRRLPVTCWSTFAARQVAEARAPTGWRHTTGDVTGDVTGDISTLWCPGDVGRPKTNHS